jgi:hypothetical protein
MSKKQTRDLRVTVSKKRHQQLSREAKRRGKMISEIAELKFRKANKR